MRANHRILLTGLLVSALTVSCDDEPLDLPIGRVTLPDTLLVLMPGETATLEASDDAGVLEPGQVTWRSDAQSAVQVADGVITAIGPGWAWVHAESGIRGDSVRAIVRFESLPEGSGKLRIIGIPGGTRELAGTLRIRDDLGTGTTSSASFDVGPAVEPLETETGMYVVGALPGIPEPGVLRRGGYEIEDRQEPSFSGSGFIFREQAEATWPDRTDYGTIDSFVVVLDEVVFPERAGWVEGRTRGIMAFQTEGIRYTDDGAFGLAELITDTTFHGVFEWDLPTEREILGGGGFHFTGGPVQSPSQTMVPAAELSDNGGVLITLSGASTLRIHKAWVPVPAEGELAVDSVGPEVAADDTTLAAPWVRAAFYSSPTAGTPYLEGFARSGTIRVFTYVPPTALEYGWIRGSVVVPMDLWSDGTPTGDETEYTATFAAPIPPLEPDPDADTEGTTE